MWLGVRLMIMDALVLIVFAISIFWSMREGLALAAAGLIKGIAAVAAAWIFCDDLAVVLLKIPSVHDFAVGKISENLSVRWENSAVYEALPKLFTSNNGDFADTLITEGATKLAWLFLTIASFLLILIAIRLAASILEKGFSHTNKDDFVGFSDKLLGLILGIVVGVFNVLLFLALLLPLAGLFLPSLTESLPGWFENSLFAKDIYNNNLLLILLRDFIA